MTPRRSGALSRNLVVLFLPWAIIVLGMCGLLREHLLDSKLQPLWTAQNAALEEGQIALSRRLAIARGNLSFLSQQPSVRAFLASGDSPVESPHELIHEFIATADYYRTVWLLDRQGNIRASVEKDGRQMPEAPLSADTIREISELNWGEAFLSSLGGSIARDPATPEMLLAIPAFDEDGTRLGAIVFSYRVELIAGRLQEIAANYGVPLGLVSGRGRWIFGPYPEAAVPVSDVDGDLLEKDAPEHAFDGLPGNWAVEWFDPALVLPVQETLQNSPEALYLASVLPAPTLAAIQREVWLLVGALAAFMLLAGAAVVVLLSQAEVARDQAMRALAARSDELMERNLEVNRAMETLHRTQSALVQAEKLSSLGTLVAGVAHELNTPIGAASMAASSLRGDAEKALAAIQRVDDRDVQRFLKRSGPGLAIVQTNLERLATFTRAFKKLASDRASTERREFDLAELLDEVVLVLGPRLKGTPHVVRREVPSPFFLNSFPGPISQILQNLIDNALVHAFEPGVNGEVEVKAWHGDHGHICIDVSDDGCGMDKDQLSRIFDPFYTTKRGRGGTGLGLHITHQLAVGILGGKIEVHSTPGEGTRFRLEVPG
ncbi:sensor histidine kinase [Pseudomonas matsuisoli]|uniref:histidine kinase n=1 Tax=Pseudomonas matsuisoli TaxID=1515666 RepID=A0A917Q134_9PSED|nr:sensor histidine kinase [Pseudomonas matsuisoli]GGK06228.1 hypothetical protein GCM10009304_35380 [Pseudomonas matsuisoli]